LNLKPISNEQTGSKDISNDNPTKMESIRRPAVAGSFYPGSKDELSNEIEGFLSNVETSNFVSLENKWPKILIVPHAGYDYSGQVAAYGYNLLRDRDIKNVIILASSHNYPVQGLITDDNDSWETPLGKVDLNKEIISQLGVKKDSVPFIPEHSLEVQLPFLQKVLAGGFKIIPILVGDTDLVDRQNFASLLKEYVDENTVFIVSSDMSHYPNAEDANKYDHKTINSILTGDVDKFDKTVSELEQKNIPDAVTFMCAQPAVELGMMLAKEVGADDIQLLKYANSGDITGDKSRVVGYSAIGFFSDNSSVETQRAVSPQNVEAHNYAPLQIPKKAGQELLKLARDSVESYVQNGAIPNFDQYSNLDQKAGVFVTLTDSGALRGCIGLMESDEPLYKTVPQMAVAAAVNDPRFNPISVNDLPDLKYEISVLSPMKKISDVSEIKLGVHGVKVKKGGNSGVFLPQVAVETGWNLEEFMNHLCQDKAGLSADCWKDSSAEIYTFTAEVFSE